MLSVDEKVKSRRAGTVQFNSAAPSSRIRHCRQSFFMFDLDKIIILICYNKKPYESTVFNRVAWYGASHCCSRR